jgi:hypothetical protein
LGQKGVTGIQGLLESAPKPFSTLNTPPLLVWLRRFVGHSVERIRAASSSLIEERFLGKGEVDSSILSGSTMHIKWLAKWLFRLAHEMPMKYPTLLPVSNYAAQLRTAAPDSAFNISSNTVSSTKGSRFDLRRLGSTLLVNRGSSFALTRRSANNFQNC